MDNILNVHIKNKEGFTIELDGTVTSEDLGVTKIASREYHIFPSKNDNGDIHIIQKSNKLIYIYVSKFEEISLKFNNVNFRNGFNIIGDGTLNMSGDQFTIKPIYVKGAEDIYVPSKKSFKSYNKKKFGISRRKYNKKIRTKIQLKKNQRNRFTREHNPRPLFIVLKEARFNVNINSLYTPECPFVA